MTKTSLLFCTVTIAVFATAAFAQDSDDPYDPALWQDGSHCAGTYWCASLGPDSNGDGTDPNTGLTTLEFVMNGAPPPSGISVPWQTGWVEDVGPNGAVEDLLDFETVGTGGVAGGEQDIVFLYCVKDQCGSFDNFSQSYNSKLNNGSSLAQIQSQIPAADKFSLGGTYTPTSSSQPGNSVAYINGIANSTPTFAVIDTPEPSAVLLLSGMLIALGVFAGKKISASS